jgi:uncharacterized protein YeeX (DUF496 family)
MDEAQFEAKLKQLRKQKEQAEEELESSAERWRTEKRRLNGEIDRLENALVEAKAKAAKRQGDGKNSGLDPALIARIQDAADEKLKLATKGWEDERLRLKSQINRLEGAVAEAIERSSNPIRTTQSVREQFEAEMDRIGKEKNEIEQAFLRARTEWEQEKLKMTGEMVKLRRAAQIMGQVVPREDAPEANPKVRALEEQFKASLAKWTAEREKLVGRIQSMEATERQWEAERRQLNDHAGQLQQAFIQAQAKIQGYEVAARTGSQSDSKVSDLKREKESLERELQESRDELRSERRRLNSEIDRRDQQIQQMSSSAGGVSAEFVEQLRKQYEQRLQDAISQKTQLAQELQSASALLETERARLTAEISRAESKGGKSAGAVDPGAIATEVARVEGKIQQIVALIDNPETELSTVIRKNVERAELDAYLKGILFSMGRSKGMGA